MNDKPSPAEKEFAAITEGLQEIVSFNPKHIYYSSENQMYFVDTGKIYRRYKSKSVVKKGILRYLESVNESSSDVDILNHFEDIEIDRAIDSHGSIAGYKRGRHLIKEHTFLVTDTYDIPTSTDGEWPMIRSIIEQAFDSDDAQAVFLGWLKGGVNAIRSGIHQPAPMIVLAGERNAGKSLLAYICKIAMGGRVANPMTAWTGSLVWNDNLSGSELLLIDDSVASTDPRKRKALGARFKESVYAGDVEINKRNISSLSMRPVWRVIICCNETPENLSVIPPLEEGIEDKIALIRVSPIKTPMPATHPEERKAFQNKLISEIPAFLGFLEKVVIPEHLRDSRSGVTAWKDAELLEAVSEISPEKRMEKLIALSISKGCISTHGDAAWMSAAEIQEVLQDRDGATSHQANTLLKFDMNAGRYLSALKRQGSQYVTDSKQINGIAHYRFTNP